MTSQPISLLRGQNHVATIRVELGGAPLDLSTASAATFIAKPSEYSPAVKITKTLGSGVAAGATGSALITITTSDAAALDISESYSWTLTATIDGTAAVVARGVLTAIGTPQQFVDDGVDRVARDAAAAALALAPQSAATAAAAAVAGLKTELPIEQRTTVPVVFIGDSFTDGQKTYPWTYSPTSYANQAAFYGSGRVAMINNAGVAGETAAQILARVDADLIAFNPRYGVVLAGTNDCVSGSEVASTMTSIVGAYRKILAAGIEPIAVTIAPIDAEPANTLATALNVEIRRVATELGIRLFDLWAFVRDPATGKIKASYAADSIHLNELGAHETGLAFLEALAFPEAVPGFLPVLVTDTGIRSDLFVDSNSDGIPDGWADGNTSGGMTFTCTSGVWTITTTGSNALVYLCALGAAPTAGTRLALAFKISTTHTNPAFAPQLYLQTSAGGTTNNLRPFTGWTMDLADAIVYAEWEVPATPGDMTLVLYAPDGAAGQIQLSKLRLFEPRS